MSVDSPAISLVGEEIAESNSSSYTANFVVYIKGENKIISTCSGAKNPLIQIENMSYGVKKYDKNSASTTNVFTTDTVNRICNVKFIGSGSVSDILHLTTADGSYGAAIGSAKIDALGDRIHFTAGQSSVGKTTEIIDGKTYTYIHGQEFFTGNLKYGNGNITIATGADIVIDSNGYGAGIGCGGNENRTISFKGSATVGAKADQSADAGDIMDSSNITITGGAVAVHMGTSAVGDCIGYGAVAKSANSAGGVVTITGGTVDLLQNGSGKEYGKVVNAKGAELYKYVFDLKTLLQEYGKLENKKTYALTNIIEGETEYLATYSGTDATKSSDLLNLSVDVTGAGTYTFSGYAEQYFNYVGRQELNFYLPTEILTAYNLNVNGDLPSVSYEYKVGNKDYSSLQAGDGIKAKETKAITIRLNNVPQFCTKVSYTASDGTSGVVTQNADGEYLYSFKMPSKDYSVSFGYEIGRYNISYDFGTNASVTNPNPDNYACGETYTLQDPVWEGHTFAGWYSDSSLTTPITTVSSSTVGDTVTAYAKWQCTVSFIDWDDNVLYTKVVDYGTRFMENDYPADPEDTSLKAFTGWNVLGKSYEKGSHPEFDVTENITIQGSYEDVGYYVYIQGTFTDLDGYAAVTDLKKMANFEMYFQDQPIAFTDTPSDDGLYYSTVEFADRSDVTVGKITAKNGYKLSGIEAKDADGNVLELFTMAEDGNAFTFQMPDQDVYITADFQTPDYTITYYDYDEDTATFVEATPEGTAGNPTITEFNANTPDIILNPAMQKDKYLAFDGWYVFGDADKTIIDSIPQGAYSKDIILIAVWEEVETYPVIVSEKAADYIKVYDADGNEVDKGIPGERLSIVVTPGRGVQYESMTYTYTDEDDGVYTNTKKPAEGDKKPYTYKFTMPSYETHVDGQFSDIVYRITYLGLMGAENPNPDTYDIQSVIELQNPVLEGYTFMGWTIVLPDDEDNYESVREEEITTIENRTGNLVLVANWQESESEPEPELKVYTITVKDGITNGTAAVYGNQASKEQYVFLNAQPERGYRLVRITYDTVSVENLFSRMRAARAAVEPVTIEIPLVEVSEGIYYFVMPEQDVELNVEFEPIEYTITYVDGEQGNNPSIYTVESDITLENPVKDGYEFLGWYNDEDEQITNVQDSVGDLTLTAKWKEIVSEPLPEIPDDNKNSEPQPEDTTMPNQIGTAATYYNTAPINTIISQLRDLIQDTGKTTSSEDTAVQNGNSGANRTVAANQILTGDTANVKHLVLLGILSLIILIIAIPKKKDDEELENLTK
jgi:uncharacterized repeat protein (TIGR02543 family)